MNKPPILLLGVGQVAKSVAGAVGSSRRMIGTTRQPERLIEILEIGVEPVVMPWPAEEIIEPLANGADILMSMAPDGTTDAILANACRGANSIVYISSTAVYGDYEGTVDDTTPVAPNSEATKLRVEAEQIWRDIHGVVLRTPGIYGPDNGLHTRMLNNTYKLPGDGTRISSRIHVDDLAQMILAVFDKGLRDRTYVVGDLQPSSHLEVAKWLCSMMDLPLPESAPLEEVHYTLRTNRSVNAQRALKDLGVSLQYPTYKEGFTACLKDGSAMLSN